MIEALTYTGQRIRAGLRLAQSFREGEFRNDPAMIWTHEPDLRMLFDCSQGELRSIFSMLDHEQLKLEIQSELDALMDRFLENCNHERMSKC